MPGTMSDPFDEYVSCLPPEVRSIVDLQLSIIQEDTLLITELENMLRQSPGQQAESHKRDITHLSSSLSFSTSVSSENSCSSFSRDGNVDNAIESWEMHPMVGDSSDPCWPDTRSCAVEPLQVSTSEDAMPDLCPVDYDSDDSSCFNARDDAMSSPVHTIPQATEYHVCHQNSFLEAGQHPEVLPNAERWVGTKLSDPNFTTKVWLTALKDRTVQQVWRSYLNLQGRSTVRMLLDPPSEVQCGTLYKYLDMCGIVPGEIHDDLRTLSLHKQSTRKLHRTWDGSTEVSPRPEYRQLYGRVRCGPLRLMRDPTLKQTLTLYPGPHAALRLDPPLHPRGSVSKGKGKGMCSQGVTRSVGGWAGKDRKTA